MNLSALSRSGISQSNTNGDIEELPVAFTNDMVIRIYFLKNVVEIERQATRNKKEKEGREREGKEWGVEC